MIYIKNELELNAMKEAGRIVAMVFEALEQMIKPGITTLMLDKEAERVIRESGGVPSFMGYKSSVRGGIDYPASICASVNNEVIHGIPSNRVVENGDIVSVDVGVYIHGFHGDAARTWGVGNISEKAERLIEVTKQSFYKGIEHAKKGNRLGDISKAIQQYVESNGYSVIRDYVGHGIGRDMHELPSIPNYFSGIRGIRLDPGMTLAIEPMVNEGDPKVRVLDDKWTVVTDDGKLSAHYENTIAITEGDPIILTKL